MSLAHAYGVHRQPAYAVRVQAWIVGAVRDRVSSATAAGGLAAAVHFYRWSSVRAIHKWVLCGLSCLNPFSLRYDGGMGSIRRLCFVRAGGASIAHACVVVTTVS